jgi:hypothetical protein
MAKGWETFIERGSDLRNGFLNSKRNQCVEIPLTAIFFFFAIFSKENPILASQGLFNAKFHIFGIIEKSER